ncbi:mitochondrial antiviral-signaling protein isoform X2 [Ictidomys tridecemlineatus]
MPFREVGCSGRSQVGLGDRRGAQGPGRATPGTASAKHLRFGTPRAPRATSSTRREWDRLRACYSSLGNQDTLWELFNRLQRRTGWVDFLIKALKICEQAELAEEVAHVYRSKLLPAPQAAPAAPGKVPGPSAPAVAHIPYNGYREDPSYPRPVQDTQPPKSPGESSEPAPQIPSSRGVLRRPAGSLEPSSNPTSLSLPTSSRHQEQDRELGGTHIAGAVCSSTSTRGPVSPTVSFQPLARSTPRKSHLPGPAVSAPASAGPSSIALASVEEIGDHNKTAICSSEAEVPADSTTTSLLPSKVPANSALVSLGPSKLPTSTKPPGAMPPKVPSNPAPSKLPINSTRASAMPPKVPTATMIPTKVPTNTMPSNGSKAKETPGTPATTVTIEGSSPWRGSSSGNLRSEAELSKPGTLVSKVDSQPFSGCTEDLAISNSLVLESSQGPEENEYMSFAIHVAEGPSADLLDGIPERPEASEPQEEEEEEMVCSTAPGALWWLGTAAASALLAVFLVVLYRRRPLR